MLSHVRLSSVCLSSVTLVRPSLLSRFKFSAIFLRYLVTWLYVENFTEVVTRNPPPGGLNARGVAKYSDFEPIEGYISETVQDRR